MCYAHVPSAGKVMAVLSRLAPCGVDYSGRPNRIAHHVVVEPAERRPEGPVAMARAIGFVTEPPREPSISGSVQLPSSTELQGLSLRGAPMQALRVARAIGRAKGGAIVTGIAGVDPIELLDASVRALPEARRWMVQFALHPTDQLNRAAAVLVVCACDREVAEARRLFPNAEVVDLRLPEVSSLDSAGASSKRAGPATTPSPLTESRHWPSEWEPNTRSDSAPTVAREMDPLEFSEPFGSDECPPRSSRIQGLIPRTGRPPVMTIESSGGGYCSPRTFYILASILVLLAVVTCLGKGLMKALPQSPPSNNFQGSENSQAKSGAQSAEQGADTPREKGQSQ